MDSIIRDIRIRNDIGRNGQVTYLHVSCNDDIAAIPDNRQSRHRSWQHHDRHGRNDDLHGIKLLSFKS